MSKHIMRTPSSTGGFEAISPIDSAFRNYLASPLTRTPSSYGFQQPPNAPFFVTEDTESNMVGAQATIEKQQRELKEAAEMVEVLRDVVKEKESQISSLDIEVKSLKKKTRDLADKVALSAKEKEDLRSEIEYNGKQHTLYNERYRSEIEGLEKRLELVVQANKAADEKYKQVLKDSEAYKVEMENKVKALNKERYRMQDTPELSHSKSHPQFSLPSPVELPAVVELQKQLAEQKALASKAHEAQKELAKVKYDLVKREEELRRIQQSDQATEIAQLKKTIEGLRSDIKEYKAGEAQLKHAQAQAKQLQDTAKNTVLLDIQVGKYKAIAERSEEYSSKAQQLEREVADLRAEKAKWEAFQGGVAGFQSPQDMVRTLGDLQVQVSTLLAREGDLRGNIQLLEATQKHDKHSIDEFTTEIESLRKTNKEIEEGIKLRDKQISFLTKEKEAAEKLLSEYYSEGTNPDQQKLQRISDLEKAVAERDAVIKSVEEIITPSQQPTTITKLTQEIQVLKVNNAQMSKELENNAKYISTLEERLGRGEFDASKSKVLTFTNNPEKMKLAAEVEKLKGDLTTVTTQLEKQHKKETQLLLQLQQLQLSSSSSSPSVPGAGSAEMLELHKKVQEADKMNTRLKQVFKTKIETFKDLIAQLLGYRIEISRDQYLLTSTFADRETDTFVFRQEGTKLVLVDSELTKQWEQNIDVYLNKCKSIPAFLSNLTLEYFNRQTYAG